MMKRLLANHQLTALLVLDGLLLACSRNVSMNANDPKPFDPQALDRGQAKLNPTPQHAYEITLTIDNAPGPFAVVEGIAQFDVTNEWECGHIDRVRGTPDRITSAEPFVLKKFSEHQYRGVIYLDYMQDDAYYDRAVCHWEFTQARARLRATESSDDTRFLPRLDRNEVLAQQSRTTYFWRGGYPRRDMHNYPGSGTPNPDRVAPEIRNELFSMTLRARKVTPRASHLNNTQTSLLIATENATRAYAHRAKKSPSFREASSSKYSHTSKTVSTATLAPFTSEWIPVKSSSPAAAPTKCCAMAS